METNTTRRALMAVAVALPVVAAGVAQAQPSGILELCAEHRRLNARYRALDRIKGTTDEQYDEIADAMTVLNKRAIAIRATTMEELRAKAGMITDIYDGEPHLIFAGSNSGRTMDCKIVESILRDLGVA